MIIRVSPTGRQHKRRKRGKAKRLKPLTAQHRAQRASFYRCTVSFHS